MARQPIEIVTCDRCKHTTKKPVNATNLRVVQAGLVQYQDLCTKCAKRVEALTDEIMAPKVAKKADGGE